MDVSIAICTHNRVAELRRTLDALAVLVTPGGPQFEIVVVDNASTDGTTEAVRNWRLHGVDTRLVGEPVPGVCRARNRAIAAAKGSHILFLDDDVSVRPGLLDAYREAINRFPDAPFFGGPIAPILEQPVTELAIAIGKRAPGVYSALDLGPVMQPLLPWDGPWGANCLIRIASIGSERFDTRIGYTGKDNISGEEVEFLVRLYKRSGPGVWVPRAEVEHRIPSSRSSWAFLQRSAYGSGRALVRLTALHGHRPWTLATMVIAAPVRYWRLLHKARKLSDSASLEDRVRIEYRLHRARGTVDESRDMLLHRSPLQRAPERLT